MPTEMAKKMHKTDPYVFSSQFMCIPKAGRQTDFDEDWFHFGGLTYSGNEPVFFIDHDHYSEDRFEIDVDKASGAPPQRIPLSWMSKAILFDPIPGKPDPKEPNCRHGLIAAGKDPWGRRFCFESVRSDKVEMEICEEVLHLARKWGCAYIAVEEVVFSYLYQPLLKIVAEKLFDGWCPQIVGCETRGRQKEQRVKEDLRPVHQQHLWYYNRVGTSEIIEELTEFPHSTYKDVSDAMAYTDQVLKRPMTPHEGVMAYYRSEQETEERGITGYGF